MNGPWACSVRPAVTAVVVPQYIEVIDSPEAPNWLRKNLIDALRPFGPAARGAIPALIRVLQTPAGKDDRPDPARSRRARYLRGSAASAAAGAAAPGTAFATDAIAALTHELDQGRGISAAGALGEFGPAARTAAPALLRSLEGSRGRRWSERAATFAVALSKVAAGTADEEKSVTLLIECLEKDDGSLGVSSEVTAALARFGPRAAAGLPRLRALAERKGLRHPEDVQKAVAAIEGSGR